MKTIEEITEMGSYIIQATADSVKSIYLRGGKSLQTATIHDDTGSLKIAWFNQPYIVNAVKADEQYLFAINVKQNKQGKMAYYVTTFDKYDPDQGSNNLGIITPQYPLTTGLSMKWLRNRIKFVLDNLDQLEDLQSELETNPELRTAISQYHFPEDQEQAEKAKRALGLYEIVALQLEVLKQKPTQSKSLKVDQAIIDRFKTTLPFELTPDQEIAVKDLLNDLAKSTSTHRLLQGDVGSGKTIVAIIGALAAASAGYQAVLLAPTTILAAQHYANFQKYLNASSLPLKIALVTGTTKPDDKFHILIGTSALLHRKDKLIHNLGLVIVDEQHRFGVAQREELISAITQGEAEVPHLLNMTATPIPRSLALAAFGNIETTIMKNKPQNRGEISSHIVPAEKREDSLTWIDQKLAEGEQAYWVCPRIYQDEAAEFKAATQIYKELQESLGQRFKIGLLHGKLSTAEKEKMLEDFLQNEIQVLVSTSVIEVGIDVPNATIMVIEQAEQFGLAQLHQLRGRVGRSEKRSWCFLYTAEGDHERLEYFCKHHDGMELALFDLKQRGPGEVYGLKQSGIPDLKVADITDMQLVEEARNSAEKLFKSKVKTISLFGKDYLQPKT